ncbi:MAG: hypothetical protein ABI628_10610 [Chloroflexota bacterium]
MATGMELVAVPSAPATDASELAVDPATVATYRSLIQKGFSSESAANLTAFMCGIQVADVHWKLVEVNRLLFLRRLARTGAWGASDGASGPTH